MRGKISNFYVASSIVTKTAFISQENN